MKSCHICKELKPFSDYTPSKVNSDGYDHRCKDCRSHQARIISNLKKIAPEKSSSCDCCGNVSDNIGLDHCHETNTFRGWLCSSCNKGLGMLGDNLESLIKVVGYLSKHKYMLDRGELYEGTGTGYRDEQETQYDMDLRN